MTSRAAVDRAMGFVDSWLSHRVRNSQIAGLTVAVHHRDSVVFEAAYGFANIGNGEPMSSGHIFAVGSQSKMWTSTAVCQLVQREILHLDAHVVEYLPWLREHRDRRMREITVRQLLSHSSGLVREGPTGDHWLFTAPFPTSAALRHAVLSSDLAVEPNSRLKYSNLGFGVLGQVIESVTGDSFARYVSDNIIKPLGLHSTSPDYRTDLAGHVPVNYVGHPGAFRVLVDHHVSTSALAPATGIHATAADMCRFAGAHYVGLPTLLSPELLKEAHRTQWSITAGFDRGAEMGLGFDMMTLGGRRLVGHSGSFGGHQSATYFDPHDSLAVSVLGNWRQTPVTTIVSSIFQAIQHFDEGTAADDLRRFETTMSNPLATVVIVGNGRRIVALNADEWEPFAALEELEIVDGSTLRVCTPGSLFGEGEIIRYEFDGPTARSISYAGITMRPDGAAEGTTDDALKAQQAVA